MTDNDITYKIKKEMTKPKTQLMANMEHLQADS